MHPSSFIGEGAGPLRALADRFRLSEAELQDLISTPLSQLQDRDRYFPPSNGTEPAIAPFHPLGTAKIDCCIRPAENAYIEVLRMLDPQILIPTEAEAGIRDHPTFERYVAWWRAGYQAPPLNVFEENTGSCRLLTSSRRRTLTAREACIPAVPCWVGIHNRESNLPLKYGDVLRAAELLPASAFQRLRAA